MPDAKSPLPPPPGEIVELPELGPPPTLLQQAFGAAGNALPEDLEDSVAFICAHARFLNANQRSRLRAVSRETGETPQEIIYGADFQLGEEVEAQIRAVRAIRDHVLDRHGNIKEGVMLREAKDVVTSGGQLLSTLMKFHKEVVNMERLRRLEQAVVAVLREEDEELAARVLKLMEESLERLN